MRFRFLFLMGVLSATGAVACMSFEGADVSDPGVNGDDQNLEEAPCKPIDGLRCPAGYHTISILNCQPNMGRCVSDGCAPKTAFQCTDGYVPTHDHCKSASAARCASPDAGADASTKDAAHD